MLLFFQFVFVVLFLELLQPLVCLAFVTTTATTGVLAANPLLPKFKTLTPVPFMVVILGVIVVSMQPIPTVPSLATTAPVIPSLPNIVPPPTATVIPTTTTSPSPKPVKRPFNKPDILVVLLTCTIHP